MSIIFLDFSRNSKEVKTSKNTFYGYSLNEQYEIIKSRIPSHKRQTSDLKDFIEKSFPTLLVKKYYFSSSNFHREKNEDKFGNDLKFLNNIVIRPEYTPTMSEYLPENTTIILIGDIQESGRLNSFIVKGIELIDKNISGAKDIVESNSYCVSTYGKKLGYDGRNQYTEWTYDRPDIKQTIFSPDFISYLIISCYPMSEKNFSKLFTAYNEWDEYLRFRESYLKLQTERSIKIDGVKFIKAHAISRKNYIRNQDNFDKQLLVNHDSFKKGDQILIKSPTDTSDEFPLVYVYKDYNKKIFESLSKFSKNDRRVNSEEKLLKDFTRENLSLSKNMPTKENYEKTLVEAFSLDERYRFISFDIEPDCSDTSSEYETKIKEEQSRIVERFNSQIKKELKNAYDMEKEKLQLELENHTKDLELKFYSNIDEIIKKNEDDEIKQKVNNLVKQFKDNLLKSRNQLSNSKKKKNKNYDIDEDSKKEILNYTNSINIKNLYIEKFEKEVSKFNDKILNEINLKLKQFENSKLTELKNKYSNEMENQITIETKKLESECVYKIKERIENETIIRFQIFFKVNNENTSFIENYDFSNYKYIIYDFRAESAKIRRQRDALTNFFTGNVKNPYLATYLFATDELNKTYYDYSDWQWFMESLNEKQREAVKKAVASKGIFLLQGPPGTGKTQVIAEVIGHLIKEGKKVLVASETHKAIDNVFERLPLIADIRPLRLVSNKSNKETGFGPENLVDNFYSNISKKMSSIIHDYENFNEYKNNFYVNYQKQRLMSDRIEKFRSRVEEINNQIKNFQVGVDYLKEQRLNKENFLDLLEGNKSRLIRTRNRLDNLRLEYQEELEFSFIEDFIKESMNIIKSIGIYVDNKNSINYLLNTSIKAIEEELRLIKAQKNDFVKQQKKKELKEKIHSYQDEYGDFIKGTENQYKPLQKQLMELSKSENIDLSNLKIFSFIQTNKISDDVIPAIISVKEVLNNIKIKYLKLIDTQTEVLEKDINNIQQEIRKTNSEMFSIQEKIRNLQDDSEYRNIQDDEAKLRRQLTKFIEDFNLSIDYQDYKEAIAKIYEKYIELDVEFSKQEQDNKKRIPIYKKISEYLRNESVIEEDRKEYTKYLFDKVNLFGITNTSRDNFSESSNDALSEYNLGGLDLKKQGIDVVIIDEVSKSSFLDLLIPILYGKSVILVGDHRQLPPMYEFRNLREQDFENIDEEILTLEKNEQFKRMYEESFFKTLFERVPEDYKVMLDQQYRSHEHIMQVYNCFYNNKLKLGYKGQNQAKEHHLNIISNNRQIIEPNKHVYFVDCKKYESQEADSTSIYNPNEAEVVIKLLQLINESYKSNPGVIFKKSKDIDERMSVGVICTYGDQARIIKNRIKNSYLKFDMFNERTDGRLIVSTVDDFQGDERDIIILSMVRNPERRAGKNPGFILAYQRINVALSRARRLLIVVGNQSYLTEKGVIDLPDVMGAGNDRKDFHVYSEVIGAIKTYGNVFDDEDVLGGKK